MPLLSTTSLFSLPFLTVPQLIDIWHLQPGQLHPFVIPNIVLVAGFMWYFSNYVNESDVCVWQTGSNDTGFERVKC